MRTPVVLRDGFFLTSVRKYHGVDQRKVPWHTSSQGNRVVVLNLMRVRRCNYHSGAHQGQEMDWDLQIYLVGVFIQLLKIQLNLTWLFFSDIMPSIKTISNPTSSISRAKVHKGRIMPLNYFSGVWLQTQIIPVKKSFIGRRKNCYLYFLICFSRFITAEPQWWGNLRLFRSWIWDSNLDQNQIISTRNYLMKHLIPICLPQ